MNRDRDQPKQNSLSRDSSKKNLKPLPIITPKTKANRDVFNSANIQQNI